MENDILGTLTPPYTAKQRADFIFKYDLMNCEFEFDEDTGKITAVSRQYWMNKYGKELFK